LRRFGCFKSDGCTSTTEGKSSAEEKCLQGGFKVHLGHLPLVTRLPLILKEPVFSSCSDNMLIEAVSVLFTAEILEREWASTSRALSS